MLLVSALILPSFWLLLPLIGVAIWSAFLWRQARRHQAEANLFRERYRQLFEETSLAIIEEDFTPVVRRLEELRREGVTDLRAVLLQQPGLAAELFCSVRILNANSHALALLGASDLQSYIERLRSQTATKPPQAFTEELLALWDGRHHVAVQTWFRQGPDRFFAGMLQWSLVNEPGRRGMARALVTFTDLTALRESEQRYRQLFEQAVEGVYETTPDGHLASANATMARTLGFDSVEELLALEPPDIEALYVDVARRRAIFAELEAKDFVRDVESEIRRRDGVIVWVKESAHTLRDASGRVICYQGFVSDITPRKRAEKALRESEDRWRLALQGSAAGLWDNNLLTGEDFYSDRSKEILGFAPDEIPNNREAWTSRIHPDDAVLGIKAMQAHLEGRASHYQVEHRFKCKDGTYKWLQSRGRALIDQSGRATRVIGTHVDINERRQVEEQLRRSEARYRMLFERSPVGIVEFDFGPAMDWMAQRRAEGVTDLRKYFECHRHHLVEIMAPIKLMVMNAATLRLVGATSREEVAANLASLMTDDAMRARMEFIVRVWEGRHRYETEVTIKALDGSLRRLHSHWWTPSEPDEHNRYQAQLALVDLTHLKSTEEALAEERERLRVMLRAMAEAVITVDTSGLIRFVNTSGCDMTGCDEAAAVGRRFDDVCVLLHGTSRVPLKTWVESVQTGDRLVDLPVQAILVRSDGKQLVVDGRGAPMHDREGKIIGAVLVLRDVSERSRLEAELQRSARLESVGLLAGGIAHDFNNILAVVMGNLTLTMMEDAVKQSHAARWLKEAEKATVRARDLTQQLLTFAQGGEPVRTAVHLNEVVREAAGFALHGARARCEFSVADDLWPASADKSQIAQVVQNLVLNAVQAMPQGGVIRISLCNEQLISPLPPLGPGRYLKLSIQDQGPGIAAEHLPRIFDPYYTTKPRGFGLGLATTYSIVKKHGGNIAVDCPPNRGAIFHVWLPASPDQPVARRDSRSPLELMKGRVLFMDDEPPIRQMAVVLLARLGMETVTAEDGAEAVRLYQQAQADGRPFDVVIMDLTVPGGMGGREAMARLREIDPQVRAIVSSGYSSDPVMANYRDYGFQAMVAKPYRIADFVAALHEVLKSDQPEILGPG